MVSLPDILSAETIKWRDAGYPCKDLPIISSVLDFQWENTDAKNRSPRYLRKAQIQSLETYWYLRLVCDTPKIIDLYQKFYPNGNEFAEALGLLRVVAAAKVIDEPIRAGKIINKISTSNDYVKEHKAEVWQETIRHDYASYIFALTMGAGKTILMGAIIATEFAVALSEQNKSTKFKPMKNALVFAPGLTIIESLKEIQDIDWEKILPSFLKKDFLANVKICYVDKSKDIQVDWGSSYNIIVSNIEKIRLQAPPRRDTEQDKLEANKRLQTIKSLPRLGVFSDEAHHVFGKRTDTELKRARSTIDLLKDNISVVVNMTGTPYSPESANRHLPEVVFWYGLKEAIDDDVLKSLQGGIKQFEIKGDDADAAIVDKIVAIFCKEYGRTKLPNGARAKIAFYFKHHKHLNEIKPLLEKSLQERQIPPTEILAYTEKSKTAEEDNFKSLNNPANQTRFILLIGKGTEGWNCPSLFATALIKEQSSNISVLQSSTRCLRQVAGNNQNASIFLSEANAAILEKELESNFKENLSSLDKYSRQVETLLLQIPPPEKLPPIKRKRVIEKVVRAHAPDLAALQLKKTNGKPAQAATLLTSSLREGNFGLRFTPPKRKEDINIKRHRINCHFVASQFAENYSLPTAMPLLKQLQSLYPRGVPAQDIDSISQQISKHLGGYEIKKETTYECLALLRVLDSDGELIAGVERDETRRGHYIKKILISEAQEKLLEGKGDKRDISYHYKPYNFASLPEKEFFTRILEQLDEDPRDIKCFLFVGGLANSQMTDFFFRYKDAEKRERKYFPDFVMIKNTGKYYIVEIKSDKESESEDTIMKKAAVQELKSLSPDDFEYELVIANASNIPQTRLTKINQWIQNSNG